MVSLTEGIIKNFVVLGVYLDCPNSELRSALPHGQNAPDATVDGEFQLHGQSETLYKYGK